MQEAWVWSLCQKDLWEEGMAIHSSILAWRIPWTEEPGGLRSIGSQRIGHDWTHIHTPSLLLTMCRLVSETEAFSQLSGFAWVVFYIFHASTTSPLRESPPCPSRSKVKHYSTVKTSLIPLATKAGGTNSLSSSHFLNSSIREAV